ncbi:hypothetical protein LP420_07595 [Massilia sp. B-10]|nr:hypothetical protein LP420_07595 [Massilia sp. B-10]
MVLSDFTEGALDYPFASLGPGISAQAIRARGWLARACRCAAGPRLGHQRLHDA